VAERGSEVAASLDVLTALIAERCDLAVIAALAAGAEPRDAVPLPLPERVPGRPVRIAVAAGPAFSFTYPDNLEALAAAGGELVPFDPCRDPCLPAGCAGMIAGGGFPETFAEALSENLPMLADVREHVGRGLVTWAECGGLLWLCDDLDGQAMAGAVAARATMTARLTLGYRVATATVDTPLGPAGTELRGHEFHDSAIEPAGEVFAFTGRHGRSSGGFGGPRLVASYLHTHLAARPDVARAFVQACSALCLPYLD
jgi:cobyrinic acid a,c-diamide synthase